MRAITLTILLSLLAPPLFADDFQIIVKGRGGHGAYPHTTIDPIVLSAQIIIAIQTLLPRRINSQIAPIKITKISGGTKRNIIPPQTIISGKFKKQSRGKLLLTQRAISKIINSLGRSAGLSFGEMPRLQTTGTTTSQRTHCSIPQKTEQRRRKPPHSPLSRRKPPRSPLSRRKPLLGQTFGMPLLSCPNKKLEEAIKKHLPATTKIFKQIHQNPELSFQEKETAKLVAQELKKLGCQVTTNIGGHGVVAIMKNGPGKTIMARADMDALPMQEKTNLPWASKKHGKNEKGEKVPIMHGCGHDVHTSCLLGAAKVMASLKDQWQGTLVLVGQPAEERGAGAKAMLADGLFNRFPRPDYIIAQHCDATLRAGKVGYAKGFYNATLSSADITLHGESAPLAASNLILALQKIAARRLDPTKPCVVTVGRISTKDNGDITLELTIRARETKVWKKVIQALEQIAKNVALAALIPGEKEPTLWIGPQGAPATINDIPLIDRALPIWRNIYGKKNVITGTPSMGGDDFGYFGIQEPKIPVFYWRLGVAPPPKPGEKRGALHSPYFQAQVPEALKSGMTAMSSLLLELLKP